MCKRPNTQWIKWLLFVLTLLVLASCTTNPPNPNAREAIIPATTKVPDQATREALTAYDPSTGTMRFAKSTSVLASLQPDDVLVSEPSSAAPYGYLRKVKAIRQEGGEVVLETVQANLTDAVHQGSLDGSDDLEQSDLASATALVEGLTVGVVKSTSSVDAGDGFRFEAKFDETVLDINEGNVKVKVRVNGSLYFNAGYNVGIGIEGCLDLPPVCVDRFEAWVGFEQRAHLQVSGEANAKITKEKKVAEYRFSPKCFAIGPVPVCIVPTVYVFVGATGEVNLSFNYNAVQTAQAKIGAKWTEDNGWEDIEPTPAFNTSFDQQFNVNAGLKARAYTKAEGALMLYGVAGPTIGAKMSIELDAAVPRDPFWILRGSLEAYYGFIVDLPVVGRLAESSGTLYEITKEFGRSPNSPPKIIIREPNKRVELGQAVNLGFFRNDGECVGLYCVFDPEDDIPSFTLTSDLDGPLTPTTHTFANAGLRTITINARDNKGATSSANFKIDVVNTPPVAYGSVGSTTVQQTVPYFISAAASDPNTKLDCSALSWSVEVGDTVEPFNISNEVCYGRAVFNILGARTITLIARDPQGAVSPARTFNVFVTDPPPNLPPTIAQPLTVSGRYYTDNVGHNVYGPMPYGATAVPSDNPLTLTVRATDPERPSDLTAISYAFWAECANCPNPGRFNIGNNQTGTLELPSPLSWYSGSLVDGTLDVSFGVTVSDGTTPITLVWLIKVPYSSLR
jgi:hypothetical protein